MRGVLMVLCVHACVVGSWSPVCMRAWWAHGGLCACVHVVWCGVMRCSVVWCGMLVPHMVQHDRLVRPDTPHGWCGPTPHAAGAARHPMARSIPQHATCHSSPVMDGWMEVM